jgi:uncharacterized protein YqgC (DUF456 family)
VPENRPLNPGVDFVEKKIHHDDKVLGFSLNGSASLPDRKSVHILIIILTAVLMATGLAGTVLPMLPGSPLIFLGAFIYAWYTGFEPVTWTTLVWLLVLTLVNQTLDFFSSLFGVKKLGGSKWGMTGALVGGILGIFFGGVLGLFLGSFLGAFLLEMIHSRNMGISLKSGVGTVIGLFFGTLGKLVIAMIMIGIFIMKILA